MSLVTNGYRVKWTAADVSVDPSLILTCPSCLRANHIAAVADIPDFDVLEDAHCTNAECGQLL